MNSTVLFYFLLLCITSASAHLASFYGNSFLFQSIDSLPRDTTTVSLRFQTSSADGLMFLAFGRSQYLVIELVNGKLEVKIDLGYGEILLSTAEDRSLNNLIWHQFKVIRSGNNIKLVLNGIDVAKDQIEMLNSGKTKFKVDFGLFLGGLGGNVTLPYGGRPAKYFRGCLLEAEFNGNDLLTPLNNIENERILYNVHSGCPKILRADKSEAMTFDSLSSYVAAKRWTTQDEGTFECMVKTSGRNGIILYNAGRGKGEFIGLEMVDGVVGASVNKGGGVVALHTTLPINDGVWHSIRFGFSPSYLDIRVDGKRTKAFVEQTSPEQDGSAIETQHHNLDLTGHLYIGGVPGNLVHDGAVPHSLVSLSRSEGVATLGGAFPGCMKNLRINHRRKSFSDFLISNQISAGCKATEFSNTEKYTTDNFKHSNAVVSRLFAVYTSEKSNLQNPSTTSTTTTTRPTTTVPQFVIPALNITTQALIVLEEEFSSFTKTNFDFIVANKGTIDEDILFIVSSPPNHGRLIKSENCENEDTLFEFTPEDVSMGLLTYCHDGSETTHDNINFNIVWNLEKKSSKQRKEIISHFVGNAELISTGIALNNGEIYSLNIDITPVNDPPKLHISSEYLFHPIKNTVTHLPPDVLNCTDPDSGPDAILYTILGNLMEDGYHIENENSRGRSILQFTQEEVNELLIVFVHSGNVTNARVVLRVSNGEVIQSNSMQLPTSVLRFFAIPLNISVSTREIILLEKSSFILTKKYFQILTNAEEGSVILNCNIIKQPSFGEIQVMLDSEDTNDERWINSSNFTNVQLTNGQVRYQNMKVSILDKTIEEDMFEFTISGAGVETSLKKFEIKIKKVKVSFNIKPMLLIDGLQEKKLAGDIINVGITHIHATDSQIQIRLEKTIQHATLFYNDNGLDIDKGDVFTLEELQIGRVSIKVKQKFATRDFNEMIQLVAAVNDIYRSGIVRFNLTYVPDLDRILLTNKGLEVLEGKEQVINTRILKASLPSSSINDNVKRFRYTVTHDPQHGRLLLIDENESHLTEDENEESDDDSPITEFTSLDLERGRLYYSHDDSETTSDYFSIRIIPILEGELPQTVAKLSTLYLNANFTITINLVNDQRPVRVVDRPFEIARNSERLLTKDDLWYKDDDTNYDDLDLNFTRHVNGNCDVLNATSRRHETILKFTQRQILNGEVLLKHEGNDFGRFVFWVRDGKHYATGLFVISASEPFVKNINASEVTVIKGQGIAITNKNLVYKTNVKGLREDIIYRITQGPRNGLLYFNKTSENKESISVMNSVETFSQQDISDKILFYEHSGSPAMEDFFQFEVSAGRITVRGNLSIKAVLESHRKPPIVQKNRTMLVAQGEKIQIRKQDIRIVHPDTKATDIIFTVKISPMMGNLEFLTNIEEKEFNTEPVTEFTQSDINRGLVWYLQNQSFFYSEKNYVDDQLLDYFTFDVTNKIMSVSNLRLYFDIIPDKIPLRVENFTVGEGRTKAIIAEYLHIQGIHFDDTSVEIRVTTEPTHGILESTQQVGVQLKSFSYRLATAEFLYYAHDGSDFLQDSFSLQAFTLDGKKKSDIVTLYVNIIPENDEFPVIVNNTGMNVWMNSTSVFTSSVLDVQDPDSDSENISYRILPPSNGWIAIKNDLSTPILKFTQAQLHNNSIIFVHKGSSTGGFTFQVDDGVNYAAKRIFVITAKPLILNVENNKEIQVFPGTSVPVTSDLLQSTTNDMENLNRTILYKITTLPKYGNIIKMMQENSETLKEFTQEDINNGMIVFKQDTELEEWSEIDSFVLTAISPPAANITNIKVMVNISYDTSAVLDRKSPIKNNEGITISEGDKFTLTNDLLDASNLYKKLPSRKDKSQYYLIYSMSKIPVHGHLSISGKNITTINTTFTQDNIMNNHVIYWHDHSDTTTDSFNFDVYLTDKRFSTSDGKPWIVPGTLFHDIFNISITPVNDNPPKLLTKGKTLVVVDGFDKTILDNVLKAVDPDNGPEDVSYSIIRPSSRGHVSFKDDRANKISKFTQQDINEEKVIFVPNEMNMSLPELKDVFYYGVTDGIQRPAYNLFQIKIVPVHLYFQPQTIEILQTTYSSTITINLLNISTNGNLSLVTFHFINLPQAGIILAEEKESNTFTYKQVLEGKVTYAMTGNQISEDLMKIEAKYNRPLGSNISIIETVDITVKPLIVQSSPFVSNDGLTRLDLSVLNATALQNKTNLMPLYSILRKPKNGQIVKVFLPDDSMEKEGFMKTRKKRQIDQNYSHILAEVDKFTHSDVSMGYVFLYTENINATNTSVADNMTMRLDVEDGSIQPAVFTLDFTIVDAEQQNYSTFFQQFVEGLDELATVGDVMSDADARSISSDVSTPPPNIAQPYDILEDKENAINPPIDDVKSIIPKDVISDDPELAEADDNVPWMIPVVVIVAFIVILAITLTIVFLHKRKCFERKPKHVESEENHSLTSQDDDVDGQDMTGGGMISAPLNGVQSDHFCGKSLTSPACPGVKVTLLSTGTRSDIPDIIQSSIYTGEDRHSISILNSTTHPHSYMGENSTTIYTPSTVYHYDDCGSVDFTDGADDDYYVTHQGTYPKQRLYHARSAKYIDPDVLALYSSDESIPSMIDEKYAMPYRGSGGRVTGSVPTGLHRTTSQPGTSQTGMAGNRPRSTTSLSKATISPELSLLPNSGLETNQYWI